MKHQILSADGTSSSISYSEEDGRGYVGHHIELNPHIKRVQYLRDVFGAATKASNPNGWEHVGRIPIPIVTDWCRSNGYSFDQWARNEDGAKDKFMRYFLSRNFSKLHNEHVTTKRESSQIVVPKSIARDALDLTGIGQ